MKKIIFLYFISIYVLAVYKERPDVLLTRGLNAFENEKCLNNDGAIRYFEDYINAGGDKWKVLKYLAYCKIKVGQTKKGEEETLKEGIKFLAEVYEKNPQDINVLKLLLSLYIQTGDYENAKTYALLIDKEKNIDNELYLLLSRLYFNTQEYHKVLNYIKKYKITPNNNEYKNEKLFMIGISYFKLGKNKKAMRYLNKLLKENNLDKELKNVSLKILKIIKNDMDYGKYPSWYNINLTNGIVFDSNIISQPPFAAYTDEDLLGAPTLDNFTDEETTAMGVRDENIVSLTFYPLNLNKHSLLLNINNFVALHYPKEIDDVFDPAEYDTVSISANTGYEYHNYFSKINVFKVILSGGYERNWTNPLNKIDVYLKESRASLNIFYRFENSVELGFFNNIVFDDFNDDDGENNNPSQDGKYFNSILYTTLPITSVFKVYMQSGYIGSRTRSDIFTYNGFTGKAGVSFSPFSFMTFYSNIGYEQKSYRDNERKDNSISVNGKIFMDFTDNFGMNIMYFYNRNNSTKEEFKYDKHLIGIYFDYFM